MRRRSWPLLAVALLAHATSGLAAEPPDAYIAAQERVVEPAQPLTLEAAIALAQRANPELAAAAREVDAMEATIRQAEVYRNPEIEGLLEDTRKETRTTTLLLSQPIELGGKRSARIGAAQKNRDAAIADLDTLRAQLQGIVIGAFYDVLAAQERVRLAQASLELAQRATNAAARRVTAGKVSPVEETRARVAESNARIELTTALSELNNARKRLAALWGNTAPRFERAQGEIDALAEMPALSSLAQRLDQSPALYRARLEVERRYAQIEVERSKQVPDITVSLGAKRPEDLGRTQAVIGIGIPIPVFDRNQGNLLEAIRRTDKARDELLATQIALTNDLAQAHERVSAARQEVQTLQRDVLPGAQSALDAATRGFELGRFDFLDVLDAQRTFFAARAQYLRALAEFHRARADIDRILGAPQNGGAQQERKQ